MRALSAGCRFRMCAGIRDRQQVNVGARASPSWRTQLRTMRGDGDAQSPDPVGTFWAWATRGLLSVHDVGFGFPLIFALLIETVSALGPAVIVALAAATRDDVTVQPAAACSTRLQLASAGIEQSAIARWLADRTEPTLDPKAISLRDLYADYAVWCRATSQTAECVETFGFQLDCVRMLPELAKSIRKSGDRYQGLRLVQISQVGIASAHDA